MPGQVVMFLHRGGTVQRQGFGWKESLGEMLRAGDEVLRAYVLDLIARKQWTDIPMLLRVMQNHTVPEEEEGAPAFNEVLASVREENAGFVQELSVKLLAEVEAREPSAEVRRDVMVLFEQAMGIEALKQTGEKVAGGLADTGAQELGVRLQEIFQQTGQWHQAVHQAHQFLRQFVKGGRGGETGAVVSMLLGLVKATATAEEEKGGAVLGHKDFGEVWVWAERAAQEGKEGAEEMWRVLLSVKAKKEEADTLLADFMEVWEAWSALDARGRREMLVRRPPGESSGSMLEAMRLCIPGAPQRSRTCPACTCARALVTWDLCCARQLGRRTTHASWPVCTTTVPCLTRLAARALTCTPTGASRGAGGPRDVAEEDGLVRAGRAYVEALWQVQQLGGRLEWAGEALQRLAWMLQQLARLCVWSGIAQVLSGVVLWVSCCGVCCLCVWSSCVLCV